MRLWGGNRTVIGAINTNVTLAGMACHLDPLSRAYGIGVHS